MEKIWLKQYPAGVPAEVKTDVYTSLVALLDESFRKYRDATAYKFMGRALSFGEIDEASLALAAWLQGSGLERGDRVAVMMPNVPQYPVAVAAILRAGYVVVNVNPLYTPRELAHQLKDSGAKAIVILENFAGTLQQVIDNVPTKQVVVAAMGDMLGFLKGMLVNHVVRRVKNMTREFAQPDYDFETAGNMMSLLLKLRASELELPDAELWIEKLARRFCINKGMTDMLAMMVHAHEPYEALVRESYKRLVTLAETSLSKAKAGQANGAIAELVSQGTTTGNTRMIELADMLRQRYQEQGLDADVLQKLEELQARYVRKPAPIKASR